MVENYFLYLTLILAKSLMNVLYLTFSIVKFYYDMYVIITVPVATLICHRLLRQVIYAVFRTHQSRR